MLSGTSISYLLGPLTAFGVVGVLVLLLRWAFGGRRVSLVERRPATGAAGEYGLLVPVAAPGSFIEGELLRRRLEDAGIRATLVPTAEGPRVMVFPDTERVARALLADTP
ncbi:MAG: hypothetical protein QOJ49_1532 [Actinomycetota bacterium]|nr:hypothetical protein [Actinomycetota bacterium]